MTTLPVEHAASSVKLQSEDYAELFEVILTAGQGTLRFWNGPERTYQGNTYESLGCMLQGEERNADEKESRPTFAVHNPGNSFAPYVLDGYLEQSTVIRKRVLKTHFENDTNIFKRRVWIISRIADLDLISQKIVMELRDATDGPNFLIPARMYMQPDFPTVNLR